MNAFEATAKRLLASALAGAALFTLVGAGSAGAQVRLRVPGEAPGIPAYAQFGFDPIVGRSFILHDEEWAAIPFYRGPCVPPDFNLMEFVDIPRVFGCPLTVAGFEIWSVYDPATQLPVSSVLRGFPSKDTHSSPSTWSSTTSCWPRSPTACSRSENWKALNLWRLAMPLSSRRSMALDI